MRLPRRPAVFAALIAALAVSGPALGKARHRPPPVSRGSVAPPAPGVTRGAPRLLVAIAVDQFSADLFAEYRGQFTQGLGRLLRGAVFPVAYQSHAATETCPGHSTILTGDHPARTGIVANTWYDLTLHREDKRVYCAEDESDPNSDSKTPVVSARHLRVPTLGELIKARWPHSRNVAVSAKDRAVMMMGGHTIDEAYWWQGQGFSTLNGRALAPAAIAENTAILATLRRGAPALALPPACAPRDRALQAGEVTVGTGRFALAPDQPDAFRVSPRVDAATLDLAARLVAALGLGRGAAPDMLAVSLSATDYIGHAFGTEGAEMCIQMGALDAALGAFFARLDAAGIDYAVALTADHGGLDLPERLALGREPAAARADAALTAPALSLAIAQELGIGGGITPCAPTPPPPPGNTDAALTAPQLVCAEGASGDYFVTRSLGPEARARVIAALTARLKAHPQVEAVFARAEIAATPVPAGAPESWTLLQRARASFDPERSGDVYAVLRRVVVPIPVPRPGYVATHGSAWDYDRRVPLLFWRKGMAGFEAPAAVETVDIAPTLAALIGLETPDGTFDGRCLDLAAGHGGACPAAQTGK